MNIMNQGIGHSQFGEGKVINQETGKISVQFSGQYGTKQFIYPDAFEKYLKMDNSEKQTSILEELNEKQMQADSEKLRKQQEYDASKELEKSTLAVKKKAAPKSTSKSKK